MFYLMLNADLLFLGMITICKYFKTILQHDIDICKHDSADLMQL